MADQLPPGIRNAYGFQICNAICWQVCLGSPLILFARELGASATTIGIIAGITPFMQIFQLPASRYAEDVGYRKLMLGGWSSRVGIQLLMALLPFGTLFLPAEAIINLLLLLMFFFTLMRGLSSCAWYPWITSIVPDQLRGTYLSRDRFYNNMITIAALWITGGILTYWHGERIGFFLVFFVGFLSGLASLYYLNRIPDPAPTQHHRNPIVWDSVKVVFRNKTFTRFLCFGAVLHLGLGAHGTFVLLFVREKIKFADGPILIVTSFAAIMGMLALRFLGPRTDRIGSKPFLGLVWFYWLFSFVIWFLLAIQAFENLQRITVILMILGGFFSVFLELSTTRLLFKLVGDDPFKSLYFAIYGSISSVLIGLAPLGWGVIVDLLSTHDLTIGNIHLAPFPCFFAVEWLMLVPIGFFLIRLHEPKAESAAFVVHQVFVGMPSRGITMLIQRFRE